MFSTFLKLYKWYQIAQSITNCKLIQIKLFRSSLPGQRTIYSFAERILMCVPLTYDSYFFYFQTFSELRIHWRLSTIIKSVWSNVFWYVKVCIFLKCIQYTIRWDKTQMFKKLPSAKINGTKNALFFLSRNPTHHSFTFN